MNILFCKLWYVLWTEMHIFLRVMEQTSTIIIEWHKICQGKKIDCKISKIFFRGQSPYPPPARGGVGGLTTYDLFVEKNRFREFSIQATDKVKKIKLLLNESKSLANQS